MTFILSRPGKTIKSNEYSGVMGLGVNTHIQTHKIIAFVGLDVIIWPGRKNMI